MGRKQVSLLTLFYTTGLDIIRLNVLGREVVDGPEGVEEAVQDESISRSIVFD